MAWSRWTLLLLPVLRLDSGVDATLPGAPAAQVPLAYHPSTSSAADHTSGGSRSKTAITPEISAFAERLLKERGVPGLSIGVVRLDGAHNEVLTEFGQWGNRTEDGDSVEPGVSRLSRY